MTTTPEVLARLRLRAQKLALVETPDQQGSVESYVAFTIGGHSLAVALSAVLHAGHLRHLTTVPGADSFLLGVTSLGGHVVSVIDAAALLRLPRRGLADITACLVVSHGSRKLGLGANQLLGIEDLPQSCIKSFPAGGERIPRIALSPSRPLLLLDLAHLLADPQLV